MDLESAIQDLRMQDYFVWDDFLSIAEVGTVVLDFEKFYQAGAFRLAGTGKQNSRNVIRSDETHWLDPLTLTPAQTIFWDRLEALKNEINEKLFLGLWEIEGHYSRYPKGGSYEKHMDRFQSDDRRTISMVLYLNSKWVAADEGALRFYLPTEPVSKHTERVDVSPIGGRLVCFLSAKVPHEVRVTQHTRLSFAAWWLRR